MRTPGFAAALITLAWSGWLLELAAQENPAPEAPLTAAAASEWLTKAGLVRNGAAWISSAEARLRKLLEEHDALEHKFYRAELARWEGLYYRQQFLLKEESAKAVRDVPRSRALDRELKYAREQYERIAKLARSTPTTPKGQMEVRDDELRKRLRAAIDARLALAAEVLEINRHTDEMLLASYTPFRQQKEVGAALAAFGPAARLGPLKRYDPLRRDMERAAGEVLTDSFPVFLDGKRYILAGLVDDQLPALFEFCPEDELTLIPEPLAREWGLALGADTPRVKLTVGERQLEAWQVQIPRLRLGKFALEQVAAVVLPAREAKGEVRLGRGALAGFEVHVEVDRCEFHLSPRANLTGSP